jgi:hypothetical protein
LVLKKYTCCICLCDATKRKKWYRPINCNAEHFFCKFCIETWLKISHACPTCRTPSSIAVAVNFNP